MKHISAFGSVLDCELAVAILSGKLKKFTYFNLRLGV